MCAILSLFQIASLIISEEDANNEQLYLSLRPYFQEKEALL